MLAELVAQRSAGDGAVDPLLAECIAPSEQARGDSLGVWRTAPEFHEAMYKPRGNPVLETVACAWAPSSRDKCSARSIWRLTKSIFSTPTVNWRPPSPEDAPLAPSENHVGDIVAVAREQAPSLFDRSMEWR